MRPWCSWNGCGKLVAELSTQNLLFQLVIVYGRNSRFKLYLYTSPNDGARAHPALILCTRSLSICISGKRCSMGPTSNQIRHHRSSRGRDFSNASVKVCAPYILCLPVPIESRLPPRSYQLVKQRLTAPVSTRDAIYMYLLIAMVDSIIETNQRVNTPISVFTLETKTKIY